MFEREGVVVINILENLNRDVLNPQTWSLYWGHVVSLSRGLYRCIHTIHI